MNLFVSICTQIKNISERNLNLDGTPSCLCKECREIKRVYDKERYEYYKNVYREIVMSFIIKHHSCCQKCNCIFLRPEEGSTSIIKIKTVMKNGIRHVFHNGKLIPSIEFIQNNKDKLHLGGLDLDHLPEMEMRSRGLLNPEELFYGKTDCVSAFWNEKQMWDESRWCQILCCICHVDVTQERLTPYPDEKKSSVRLAKEEYVRKLKTCGCQECKLYKEDLLRCLEFDHIDPSTKITTIGIMVCDDKYSLEDLIEECKKCRILCRMCHRLYTEIQIKQGLIPIRSSTYIARPEIST